MSSVEHAAKGRGQQNDHIRETEKKRYLQRKQEEKEARLAMEDFKKHYREERDGEGFA